MLRPSSVIRAAAVVAAFLPLPAFAHAILLGGNPAPGGTVAAGTVTVELRFNSRIDGARSTLRLSGPERRDAALPLAPETPPDILRTTAELTPGKYTIRWQVLAVDGHVTRGEVPFTVTAKP